MKSKLRLLACLLCCLLACPSLKATDNVTSLPNVVYVQGATLQAGSEAVLTAVLKNNLSAVGFQFDLCLPAGFTLSGSPSSSVAPGSIVSGNKHIVSAASRKDGSCRVLCYSLQNTGFTSSNGSAAEIRVKVGSTVAAGSYPVVLKNVEITTAGGLKVERLKTVTTTLVVDGSVRGDVNGDGEVGIGDIVAVTNVMAGITTDAAIVGRADVNVDGEVGIGDIVAITNIMAGTSPAREHRANKVSNPKH